MSLLLLFGNCAFNSTISLLNTFGAQSTTEGTLHNALGFVDIQALRLSLGSYIKSILGILNELALGDVFGSVQVLRNSLVDEVKGLQMLVGSLPENFASVQTLENELLGPPIQRIQAILNKIYATDYVQGNQLLANSIGRVAGIMKSVPYNIYLDGRRITDKIHTARITCNESNIHNVIEISSISSQLYYNSDPLQNKGTARIEAHVGSRILYFLLEERSGDEVQFNLWGRSLSAREDSPYAHEITYTLSSATSARSIAENLTNYSAVSWLCNDYVLPKDFQFKGTPMDGISAIANVIDAVIRSDDDGTIIIRNRYTTRPIDLNGTLADISYTRDDILRGISYKEIPGEGFNSVEVLGSSTEDIYPSLLLEESSPIQGDTIHVRVYWDNIYPPTIPETAMTSPGKITKVITTEKVIETVEFSNGIATSSYPIISLQNTSWKGVSLGSLTVPKYSKNLTASKGADTPTFGYGIAEITYQTIFTRYELSQHDIDMLIFILSYTTGKSIDVVVRSMGDNDTIFYAASAISDSLISASYTAVIRGLNYLDSVKYDSKVYEFGASYDDLALDGSIAFVSNAELECSGNFYIKGASILFEGPKVINELELIQWQV